MTYMILDITGNAIDTFDDAAVARATLRSLVREDPAGARELVLLAYDGSGRAVGEAVVGADVASQAAHRC